MGKALREAADNADGVTVVGLVDKFAAENGVARSLDELDVKADVIIDFTTHTSAPELCEYAVRTKSALVVATTGHSEDELAAIKSAAASVPVFLSANMSLGVAVLRDLVRRAVAMFPDADVEIVETHHDRKLDSPSGTALLLAESVKTERPAARLVFGREGQAKRQKDEIGMHSLRMGNVVGEHTVYIATDNETLALSHHAASRAVFADGALVAAKHIVGKRPGLYDMTDVLGA
jgi:4-hydroxy-tetrahydrodipicolinate reductase